MKSREGRYSNSEGSVMDREMEPTPGSPLFDNLVWLNTKEAAIYLRKLTEDGRPSEGAIRTMVCRRQIIARKWRRRLYFKKAELEKMLDASLGKGGRYGN